MFIVRVSNTFTLRYPKTVLFEGWLPLLAHLLFVATGPMPRTLINLLDHHQNSKKRDTGLNNPLVYGMCCPLQVSSKSTISGPTQSTSL